MEQLDIYRKQWRVGTREVYIEVVHKIQKGKDEYLKRQVGKLDLENKERERTKPLCYRVEVL